MNRTDYAKVRETLGSQRDVAKMLGVDIRTVQRREVGDIIITNEAVQALLSLSAIRILKDLTVKTDNREKFNVKEELDKLVNLLAS